MERNVHSSNMRSPRPASHCATGTSEAARRSTSITMLAIVLLIGVKTGAHVFSQSASEPHQLQEQGDSVREEQPVRIVDPTFCENQTWPYIDARCLKRVEPAPVNEEPIPSKSPPKLIAAEAAPTVRSVDSNVPSKDLSAALPPRSAPTTSSDTRNAAQHETNYTSDNPVTDAPSQPNVATAGDADQFWGRSIVANEMQADSDLRHQSRHRHRHAGRVFGFRF
jgi:hypothetical protein